MKRFVIVLFYILISCVLQSCDILPDEETVNQLPDYYIDNGYLDMKAREIIDSMEKLDEFDSFFWITDIHWEPDLNSRNSPAMIHYISKKTGIGKILNGGDTGNSSVICTNAINRLRNAVGSNMVYTVNGNHETNDASRYERPFHRVHKSLRAHCDDIVYGDEDKTYFYFDNVVDRVRYVGLSSFGLYVNNQYESAYTEDQLKWFKNIALDVDDGWTIIIFTHALYVVNPQTDKISVISQPFVDAIDQYTGKGKIACVLMGHSHVDRIHVGKSGVPYILSQCDRTIPYRNDINVERQPGTVSEQHFEVVLLDKKGQQVILFSIGSDARSGVDHVKGDTIDMRVLDY